jgi:hypothetical protein
MKVDLDLSELDKMSYDDMKNFILNKLSGKKKEKEAPAKEEKEKEAKENTGKNLKPIRQLSHIKVGEMLIYFQENRQEQFKCARSILDRIICAEKDNRIARIVVIAEEKSGKREISQILALLVKYFINTKNVSNRYPKQYLKNIYFNLLQVCGLVRKSCESQYIEFRKRGIYAETISKKNDADNYIEQFNSLKEKKTGIIVLDELDYASAINGKMEPFIDIEKSHVVAMSSTAWDATKAQWVYSDEDIIRFQPSNKYCGGEWFVSEGLVEEAKAFINKEGEYTEQALSMIKSCINEKNERNCIVIRLPAQGKFYDAYRNYKEKKNKGDTFSLYGYTIHESFLDGNTEDGIKNIIEKKNKDAKVIGYSFIHLIYITGKLTRSTELPLNVKRYLWAWHDFRILKDRSCMQAVSQAVGRIKHYKTPDFPDGHRIRLYCDPIAPKYWENPEKWDVQIKNLSARTKSKKNHEDNVDWTEFSTFEEAFEFSKTELGHTFDIQQFRKRKKDEHGRIMNNIRGTWKIIPEGDTPDYTYGIKGAGASTVHDRSNARIVVSYHMPGGRVPTYIVVWPKERKDEKKLATYNHKPRNNNAYQ